MCLRVLGKKIKNKNNLFFIFEKKIKIKKINYFIFFPKYFQKYNAVFLQENSGNNNYFFFKKNK